MMSKLKNERKKKRKRKKNQLIGMITIDGEKKIKKILMETLRLAN